MITSSLTKLILVSAFFIALLEINNGTVVSTTSVEMSTVSLPIHAGISALNKLL